ncbi:glycoside hydrolase family 24 protein [Enterobacter cloacae]|uniref:glycoside hydrolase family 24 protein n=1 Tax=Enterobacter cloacae TaxID=550 RepID=UPI000589666A|nr:glycoside hydrolase family 104 protein [Enterobacter cloacae]KIF96444.1 lysozyme [Enterobacter cloacae]
MHPNMKALLDTIAVTEGTSTNKLTKNDGYDVIVTGVDGQAEIFTDYSTHPFAGGRPGKIFNNAGQRSTASGRYQHLVKDWEHYRAQLLLPDFSPESQDRWAIQLIKERKAVSDIENGNIETAIKKICNIWASLPGAGYGQHEFSMAKVIQIYQSKGGTVAK